MTPSPVAANPSPAKPQTETPLADDFRAAMRQLAATVCVITAGEGAARRGLTATAVCSLSVDPPAMLVCVNRSGQAHHAIAAAGAFCVNILAAGQRDTALRFAGQGGEAGAAKFAPYGWTRLATGAPALDGALVNLDCALTEATAAGTHSIFIGTVRQIRFGAETSPLLHWNRAFHALGAQTAL